MSYSNVRMPTPSRKRSLEIGAGFIENDLNKMRQRAQELYEQARGQKEDADYDGRQYPIGSSHEGDLMKAVEWAWAAATLRALAAQEDN